MGFLGPQPASLRVELTLHHQTAQLGHATPSDSRLNAHVKDDVAVFLEEVPISPLGYWHHLQILGEAGT